jgi:predicted RNA-binding Zn-ribbon protein involved in translation (DUF1610 family)
MSTEKPSRNEEEYFAKLEAEKLEQQRTRSRELAITAERATHYMKCPQCGADLVTQEFHGVQVIRCPECHGLWLDASEIEAVVAHEDQALLRRVFTDFMITLRSYTM